jgi:hypothetical protein
MENHASEENRLVVEAVQMSLLDLPSEPDQHMQQQGRLVGG